MKEQEIIYGVHTTPFGKCVIGILGQGVCHISFLEKGTATEAEKSIISHWPQIKLQKHDATTKKYAERIFISKKPVVIIMKGTDFQKKVWDALREIPWGTTLTYADIAEAVGKPKAVRAVGTACGKNSIAFLIPCHRVVTSDGKLGGYRWGIERKKKMLEWEQVRS
jgi:AraC family transcriptional regulator of adaptative response/methylated-DNA-[protein]-cysteine methyltransferase